MSGTRLLRRTLSSLSLTLTLGGCATAPAIRPAADIAIVASAPSPEVDAFVEAFFKDGPASPRFADELRDALRKHPTSGALHEVAAYWARLSGDDHAAWEHFLTAAADTHHAGASLDLEELEEVNLTRAEMLATAQALPRIAT